MLGTLEQLGLTAFVTLHHFTLPRWLAERGGWLAPDAVERFARYVERVAAALGDLMPFAGTINEPQIVALMGYREGLFPPGLRNPGHVRARHAAADRRRTPRRSRRSRPAAATRRRASACSCRAFEPARPDDPACVHGVRASSCATMEDVYLEDLAGDWVGVQYYTRQRVDPAAAGGFAPAPAGAPLTQMGWEIHPEGLHRAIVSAARAGLPVVRHRERHRHRRRRAADRLHARPPRRRSRGRSPTASTCAASTTGPRSTTSSGPRATGPTFGLIGIDREDGLRRVVRPSARAYGTLARTGSLDHLTGAHAG